MRELQKKESDLYDWVLFSWIGWLGNRTGLQRDKYFSAEKYGVERSANCLWPFAANPGQARLQQKPSARIPLSRSIKNIC